MAAIRRKLKSRSGISLAIALVFFLLCAMVGTVVLAAASASAGNTARERLLYRQTLALTSAADVLRVELQKVTFSGTCVKTETVTTTAPAAEGGKTTVTTEETWAKGSYALTDSTLFASESWKDALANLFYANELGPAITVPAALKREFTFPAVETKNIPEVTATLTMAADYTVTVALRCGKSGLTMTFPPKTKRTVSIPENPVEQTTSGNTTIKATKTNYTTTLSWEPPLIKEGTADETTP